MPATARAVDASTSSRTYSGRYSAGPAASNSCVSREASGCAHEGTGGSPSSRTGSRRRACSQAITSPRQFSVKSSGRSNLTISGAGPLPASSVPRTASSTCSVSAHSMPMQGGVHSKPEPYRANAIWSAQAIR